MLPKLLQNTAHLTQNSIQNSAFNPPLPAGRAGTAWENSEQKVIGFIPVTTAVSLPTLPSSSSFSSFSFSFFFFFFFFFFCLYFFFSAAVTPSPFLQSYSSKGENISRGDDAIQEFK
jgi:hypothetical protein